jgi:hypothetical protein
VTEQEVTEQVKVEEFAAEEETAVDSLEEPPLGGQNDEEETETAVDIEQGLDTEVEHFENEEDVAVEDYEG